MKFKKILKYPAIIAFILFFIFLIAFLKMKIALPKYDESLHVDGLMSSVEIHTDPYGVPHIFAENKKDLYFGLGYAQARERMFQMQILKRITAGRLSEVIGSKGLKIDKLMRTLGIRHKSELWLERNSGNIPPEAFDYIDAYINGINHYRSNHSIPIEFLFLSLEFEPLERVDLLAFVGFMGLGFAEAINSDPILSSIEKDFPKEMLDEIQKTSRSYTGLDPSLIPDRSETMIAELGIELKQISEDIGMPLFQGSNSWLISPSRSESGMALFSNDPHIGYSNPSIWFEAYLNTPDFELYGHYLPLIPFAPIGFNKNYAWGLTMFENDDMDFYLEKESSEDSSMYYFKGELKKYATRKEVIHVRGGEDIEFVIKETIHGPLLNGIATSMENETRPISVKWPMFEDSNNVVQAFFGMNHAKDFKEFESSVGFLLAPGLNISYADREGSIAHFSAGAIPERNFPSDRILDGSSGLQEWGSFVPPERRPKNINPPSGTIFTANHIHHKNVSYPIEGYWQSDDRSSRISHLLNQKEKHSLGSIREIVLDDYFDSADYILPLFFKRLENRQDSFSRIDREVLKELKAWDRRGNPNEPGALIFSELRIHLIWEIFQDELGESRYTSLGNTIKFHHFLKRVFQNETSAWWDNVHTPERETPADICELALLRTTASLLSRQGSDLSKWKWGKDHTLELKHALGEVPGLNVFFNSGPRQMGGGTETINNLVSKISKADHRITAGPSMRTLIDFSQSDNILIINPLGQSGHRLSPHFQDQANMFRDGKFRSLNLREMKSREKKRITTLIPK